MYIISKEFHFCASHQLKNVAPNHPCSRLHGHNYVIAVELQSPHLDASGFVRDYLELSALKDYIDEFIDHRHLNEVLGDDCVTAEQMAKYFYDWCLAKWPETTAVRISETPKTFSEYRPTS